MWQRKELRLTDRLCKQGSESWTEVARLMKSLDQAAHSQSDQHRNPPSYGVVVTLTIFFPIVGLIMGIVWLSQPRYRGAGGAILGISVVVGIIWYAVIHG